MTDKKPGGRRPGSGRPPKDPSGKQVRLYFSVPPDVAELLLMLDRRSEWLTEVTRRELGTKVSQKVSPSAATSDTGDTTVDDAAS